MSTDILKKYGENSEENKFLFSQIKRGMFVTNSLLENNTSEEFMIKFLSDFTSATFKRSEDFFKKKGIVFDDFVFYFKEQFFKLYGKKIISIDIFNCTSKPTVYLSNLLIAVKLGYAEVLSFYKNIKESDYGGKVESDQSKDSGAKEMIENLTEQKEKVIEGAKEEGIQLIKDLEDAKNKIISDAEAVAKRILEEAAAEVFSVAEKKERMEKEADEVFLRLEALKKQVVAKESQSEIYSETIEKAKKEASEIVSSAKKEATAIIEKYNEEVEKRKIEIEKEAQGILEDAKSEAQQIIAKEKKSEEVELPWSESSEFISKMEEIDLESFISEAMDEKMSAYLQMIEMTIEEGGSPELIKKQVKKAMEAAIKVGLHGY